MADPAKPPSPPNELEREFARPLVQPEGDDGIGPTLGEDVGSDRKREPAKHDTTDRS